MSVAAIGCKRTIGCTAAIGTIVAFFAFIAFFCAIDDAITTEPFFREPRTIGFAVVISASATCIAAKCCIEIAFVAGFSVTDDAIAASPFAIGFATAKAAIIAFLERTSLATLTFFTWFTNLALIAFITGFGAVYFAIATERRFCTIGIAAAISAIAAEGITRSIDDCRQTIDAVTIVAFFFAVNQTVAAIPRPVAHIAIGGAIRRIPAISRCIRIVG